MRTLPLVGLFAITLQWLGLLFVVVKWPRGRQYTFSQHVVLHRSGIIFYIALFTITLPILSFFLLLWLQPTHHLSFWFDIFVVASVIAQYLCTFIPETTGRRAIAHRVLAGLSALCLLPATLLLLPVQKVHVLVVICSAAMLLSMATATLKQGRSISLWLQVTYYLGFFAPIGYLALVDLV